MMKTLSISLFILFLLPCWLISQQDESGDFQDGIFLEQISPESNRIIQVSPGNFNGDAIGFGYKEMMELLNSRIARAEKESHMIIHQEGEKNVANMVIEGRNNAMEVLQLGNENLYEGKLIGDENLIHVLQNGHLNKLYQVMQGDGAGLQVIQEGQGLELIQIEAAGNAPAYQIHQRGEGMKLHIEHNY